jgi:two-component system, cell cycle response regulator DivK
VRRPQFLHLLTSLSCDIRVKQSKIFRRIGLETKTLVVQSHYDSFISMTEKDPENLTVLIVEDVEDARYFMRLELEQLGYFVIEAEDGAKAVEIALREHPDIVLMDLTLPVMDGLAATAMIRDDERMSKVPIIAVTAHQDTDLRAEAKASGFDAYVTKPIDIPWLNELMKGLLV